MGDKHKSKDAKKDKKHKKEHKKDKKKSKKHRSRDFSDSSSSSEDEAPPSVDRQLAMGRAAARAIREILAYKYELRDELRQLARHLDGGNALDISGIVDAFLLSRLRTAFDNLLQLRKTSSGHYSRRPGSTSVMGFIAPFMEESQASLASYVVREEPPPSAAQGPAPTPVVDQPHELMPAAELPASAAQGSQVIDAIRTDNGGSHPAAVDAREELPEGLASDSAGDEVYDDSAPIKRVLGPMMPPPELLAAAAAMGPALDEGSEGDSDEEFIVGPPPPEYLESADLGEFGDSNAAINGPPYLHAACSTRGYAAWLCSVFSNPCLEHSMTHVLTLLLTAVLICSVYGRAFCRGGPHRGSPQTARSIRSWAGEGCRRRCRHRP